MVNRRDRQPAYDGSDFKLTHYLIVIAILHLAALLVVVFSSIPLPKMLVELDSLYENQDYIQRLSFAHEEFAETYKASLLATVSTLNAIKVMKANPVEDIETYSQGILTPWLNNGGDIFWFSQLSDLYNFAVYLVQADGKLHGVWRDHHRNIEVQNRIWSPGRGHIGISFARAQVLVSSDASVAGVNSLVGGEGLSEYGAHDFEYYNSFISAPIIIDNTAVGVFVVTSSRKGQFREDTHGIMGKTVAELIAISLPQNWKGYSEWIAVAKEVGVRQERGSSNLSEPKSMENTFKMAWQTLKQPFESRPKNREKSSNEPQSK